MTNKIIYFLSLILINTNVLIAEEVQEKKLIKIGVSIPLTGDVAEYGNAVKNGIELAKSQDPTGFANLEFIYEDNQYDAAKAVTTFKKLKDIDKVSLIYNWGEPTLGSVAPIAESLKFPILAMSLDRKPAENKKFIILTINYADQFAEKLVSYLRSKGIKNIGIIHAEDPFLNSMILGIKENLKTDETLKVIASVNPTEQDFKLHITKLKNSKFEAVGVYLFPGQLSTFFRQATTMKFESNFFGTDFFESRTEIAQSNHGMENAVYPNVKIPENFSVEYLKKYKNDAQIAYAYNAYEFAKTSATVLPKDNSNLNSEEIIDLYLKKERSDIFTVEKTPEGVPYYKFPLVMKVIKNDKFSEIN